jgi:hypothetical protein
MTEHYMQEEWNAAQREHDAEIVRVSAEYPDQEWIPALKNKGWVRRQDA